MIFWRDSEPSTLTNSVSGLARAGFFRGGVTPDAGCLNTSGNAFVHSCNDSLDVGTIGRPQNIAEPCVASDSNDIRWFCQHQERQAENAENDSPAKKLPVVPGLIDDAPEKQQNAG